MGLCKRAGKLAIGTPGVTSAIRSKQAQLVFLTADAAPNAVKRITDSSTTYQIQLLSLNRTKSELGSAVGQSGDVVTVAVLDHNFKKAILETYMTEADSSYPQEV